jgi:hypothetical protein
MPLEILSEISISWHCRYIENSLVRDYREIASYVVDVYRGEVLSKRLQERS